MLMQLIELLRLSLLSTVKGASIAVAIYTDVKVIPRLVYTFL